MSFLDSTFEQKRSQPIVLGSHKILDDNNLICDGKQVLEIQEVSDVICSNQVYETQVVNDITCDSNQIHKLQHDNNLTCYSNQIQTTSSNLSCNRRLPVTRSNDIFMANVMTSPRDLSYIPNNIKSNSTLTSECST